MSRELPILFNGEMVRAILAGAKTQTRRAGTAQNTLHNGWPMKRAIWPDFQLDTAWVDPGPSPAGNPGPYLKARRSVWDGQDEVVDRLYSRWCPGDVLWVRETFGFPAGLNGGIDEWSPAKIAARATDAGYPRPWCPTRYRADDAVRGLEYHADTWGPWGRWRPSIHMPRWACRLRLRVTDVRVERVQSISRRDARAEGCTGLRYDPPSPHAEFISLWESINESRGFGWDANPYVWAVTFERMEES